MFSFQDDVAMNNPPKKTTHNQIKSIKILFIASKNIWGKIKKEYSSVYLL